MNFVDKAYVACECHSALKRGKVR